MEVVIRQAHPGPDHPPYTTFNQKFRDAERYVREEALPWAVVVDDLKGTVHHAYWPMSDPSFLIGADGRVSYYEKWTSAAALHRAIEALFAQGGSGIVGSGIRRRMQLGPSMTDGWRAIERGLPQSAHDLSRAAPLSAVMLKLGYALKPFIGPVTLRARPLLKKSTVVIAATVVASGVIAGLMFSARGAPRSWQRLLR